MRFSLNCQMPYEKPSFGPLIIKDCVILVIQHEFNPIPYLSTWILKTTFCLVNQYDDDEIPLPFGNNSDRKPVLALYPQIRPHGIKNKAAISLQFNLHCKAIAALLIYSIFEDIATLLSASEITDRNTFWHGLLKTSKGPKRLR